MESVCIVGCTAHKRSTPMAAEELYSSDLFFKSRRYAQANFDRWVILSAKHGIVTPGEEIAPYDQDLAALSVYQRNALALRVKDQIESLNEGKKLSFTSICGQAYDSLLKEAGVQFTTSSNLSLPIGKKLQALTRATDPLKTEKEIDAAYEIVARLAKGQGLKPLREVLTNAIPESGIYLFFDKLEKRLRNNSQLRVVRVGTHGVAAGSKASLRNRIRTHLGTTSGEGNHRSSIFRLHVGSGLIRAGHFKELSSWGEAASTSKAVLSTERELERAVSQYLGDLLVLTVDVPGESAKWNDRAYLEQNLIALLSNSYCPLDPPSYRWLGLASNKKEIRKSGLWNVNHTNQRHVPGFLEILDYYVSLTVGTKKLPRKKKAPSDWPARVRENGKQLSLL